MKFPVELALKNIKKRPFRSFAMAAITMVLSFTLFLGAYMIMSLQNGLSSYKARLGADVIVVPISATSHGAVDDIFLQGITGNYYMNEQTIKKIYATEGIESITRQFYLTSAKASCCSSRVQIIGFDPETDFSITPWIAENYKGQIEDDDIIVGANINVPADREIMFYGQYYHVAAQLADTGTGLDSAVYTNMKTIRKMAENARTLLDTSPFEGVSISTAASAVLIKVADGYSITDVTDDINIHVTKVQATAARTMISDMAQGLEGISRITGILVVLIWLLGIIVMGVSFTMMANERKKEYAVLRIMGASRKMLFKIIGSEAAIVSAAGAIVGLAIAVLAVLPFSKYIQNALALPFLTPGLPMGVLLGVSGVIISVFSGSLAAFVFSGKITADETGLLLREDA